MEDISLVLGKIILGVMVLIVVFSALDFISGNYISCHIKSISSDKYCQVTYLSNISNYQVYEVRSYKAELLKERQRQIQEVERKENKAKEQRCYEEGYDYQKDLDIIRDYGLSCKRIAYINDHLIDERINGGYIKGSYSGFFSHVSIEGSFDIMKDSLATGKLIQNISYHINCRNETINQKIDYYDESEFVLYYVQRCLI